MASRSYRYKCACDTMARTVKVLCHMAPRAGTPRLPASRSAQARLPSAVCRGLHRQRHVRQRGHDRGRTPRLDGQATQDKPVHSPRSAGQHGRRYAAASVTCARHPACQNPFVRIPVQRNKLPPESMTR